MTSRIHLPDLAATEAFAARLVQALPNPPSSWLLLLQGELGSGKSTLARAILRQYGFEGPVPSPTYTLVEPYSFSTFNLYHIDLYRIKSAEELEFLGWSDLEQGFRIVEWPERIAALTDLADVQISLSFDGSGRIAELSSLSPRGTELIRAVAP